MNESTYALISGVSRSGTSLVTSLIGKHQDCIAMMEHTYSQEHKIISNEKIIANKITTPRQIQLEHPKYPFYLRRYLNKVVRNIRINTSLDMGFRPEGVLSIREYVEKRDAKLLFIIRKPDHIIDSLVTRGTNSISQALRIWEQGIRELIKSYNRYEKRTRIIQFEELVIRPYDTMDAVFEFFSVQSCPSVVDDFESQFKYNRSGINELPAKKKTKDYGVKEKFPRAYNMYSKLKTNSVSN